MRVAIVIGTLATLLDKLVFQPTYLFDDDSGLRDVLLYQAGIDSSKERYARGILLSMLSDEQETRSNKETANLVVSLLLDTANVQVLLDSERVLTVENELQQLVLKFQESWRIIQRGEQKLDTNFDPYLTANKLWYIIETGAKIVKEEHRNKATSSTTTLDEDNTIVVPQVCLIATESDPVPITHGYVIRRTCIDAAEKELRRDLPSAAFARAPTGRHRRTRSFRTTTVASHAPSSSGGHKRNRFL
jgi:hypothetical protein